MFRLTLLFVAIVSCVGVGCRHHGQNRCDHRSLCERIRDRHDGKRRDTGTDRDSAIPPGVILPRGETIPATPLPVTPSRSDTIEWDPNASLPAPRRSSEKIPADLPPAIVPSDPVLAIPPPGKSNRTLLLPDPLLLDPLRTGPGKPDSLKEPISGILGEPILSEPTKAVDEAKSPNPSRKSDLPTDSVPAGVEAYAPVPGQENVASGKKPTLEGLDALKANGFKTVLYLHAPDADLSAAKETVEKRGLKFVALAVSPQTLGRAAEVFAEQLKDAASKPLFVYDLDGVRAGSLWYLQFRQVEMLSDEVARIRAGALGLRDASTSEEQKQFWIAIQDRLGKR